MSAAARLFGATDPPLVLASRSASRRAMLEGAGLAFETVDAPVDERGLEARLGSAAPEIVALALAKAKARAGAEALSGRRALVLGSDSLVSVSGRRYDKPASREEAEAHLRAFSGRTMALHSAAALVQDGRMVWSAGRRASLKVRSLSDGFIAAYLDAEWPAIGACAGAFRIEGPGVHLFERIDGDRFTVLGVPLLPVLAALRKHGGLP